MERPAGVRMTSINGSGPRTPVSHFKRKGSDNGMQSDLLKLLEDLGTDSPIKPMEDYGLPSMRPSSLAQYDQPTTSRATATRDRELDVGSSPMERSASESMLDAQQSGHPGRVGEKETPSPLYQYKSSLARHGRGPTPPSGSSLSSLKSAYSISSQRSTESSGLTDSATLNSMGSIALTPEIAGEDQPPSAGSHSSSSRYVPSAGRTFNRTVSAPIQMGRVEQAGDEYEELSLTNRKRADLGRSVNAESTRERNPRQPLSQDYGTASSSLDPAQESYKTPATRRRVMEAAVQGSTGGKRFAMKAQRPVRDNTLPGDPTGAEDHQEPVPRWNLGEPSSSRPVSSETRSAETSPRQRIHAIPSTIHEDDKEDGDMRSASRSVSPRFDHNAQSTITNSTVRGQGRRGTSPSYPDDPTRPGSAMPDKQYHSPSLPAHFAQPLNPNKENRDPYDKGSDGQMERMTTDSKIWTHGKPIAEKPQSPPLHARHTSAQLSQDFERPEGTTTITSTERNLPPHAPHATAYQQYQGMPTSVDLPLITPTTVRSLTSTDRRVDEAPLPHHVPPFVAYNAYQQAMTPLANGYPHMQMQQQAPPTVSQLPAGRKAFTVNNKEYERLGILGRGGSSKVYSVLCPTKRTVMALKRVALERCDQETITNYMNEVALLNRLRGHDRIIQLMECQVIRSSSGRPKTLQMLMECGETDFSSLLDEQRGKPLNMNFVALYWQQMLEAVQAVHEQKVVHSDLKPANFVLVKGRLKIIDFGIAKAIANDTVNIQRDVQIGTVNYMSPEAVHKMKGQAVYKLSYPSDVWSLGCILYQMIYGNPPFHGISGGAMIKMQVIGSGQHVIEFPERVVSKITDASDGRVVTTQQISIPYSARHTMRSCLSYQKESRLTIEELLAHNFLKSGHDSVPELSNDQILMTQSQMRRLVDHVLREAQAGSDVGNWRQEVTSLMFNELRSQYETAFGQHPSTP